MEITGNNKIWNGLLLILITISFLTLDGCGDKTDPFAIADDVIPVETLPNESTDKPVIGNVTVCNFKSTCLITSSQISYGEVNIINDESGNVYVEFRLDDDYYFEDLYLVLGNQFKEIPRFNNGMAAVEKFPYSRHFENTGTNLYTFKLNVGDEDKCYVLAANAVINNTNQNQLSLWAGCTVKEENTDAFYINENIENGLYIGYCYKGCESIDFTYAFEDLNIDGANDTDYNDLVAQAQINEVYRTADQVEAINMTYWAKARGANYDHDFSLKIPVTGKSRVVIKRYNSLGELMSSEDYEANGELDFSVFPTTRMILQPNGYAHKFASNTDTTRDSEGFPPCLVTSWKTLVNITIDDPASNVAGLDLVQPYDPYIVVTPNNGVDDPYELHIYSITGTGTFMKNGETFPNGIIVPDDWSWPLELVPIKKVYPSFPVGAWYTEFADNPQGYYDVNLFGPRCE